MGAGESCARTATTDAPPPSTPRPTEGPLARAAARALLAERQPTYGLHNQPQSAPVGVGVPGAHAPMNELFVIVPGVGAGTTFATCLFDGEQAWCIHMSWPRARDIHVPLRYVEGAEERIDGVRPPPGWAPAVRHDGLRLPDATMVRTTALDGASHERALADLPLSLQRAINLTYARTAG